MHVHMRPFALPQPAASRPPRPAQGPERPGIQRVSERPGGEAGRGGAQQQPDRRKQDRPQPADTGPAPHDPAATLASTLVALALAHLDEATNPVTPADPPDQ